MVSSYETAAPCSSTVTRTWRPLNNSIWRDEDDLGIQHEDIAANRVEIAPTSRFYSIVSIIGTALSNTITKAVGAVSAGANSPTRCASESEMSVGSKILNFFSKKRTRADSTEDFDRLSSASTYSGSVNGNNQNSGAERAASAESSSNTATNKRMADPMDSISEDDEDEEDIDYNGRAKVRRVGKEYEESVRQ